MLLVVGCGELNANSSLSLGNNGVIKSDHVDSFSEEVPGHVLGELGIVFELAEHDRADRVIAGRDFKPGLAHIGAEIFLIPFQLVSKLGCLGEKIKDGDRGGDDYRRNGVAEKIGPRALPVKIIGISFFCWAS